MNRMENKKWHSALRQVSEGGSEKQRGLLPSTSTHGIRSSTHVGRRPISEGGTVGTGVEARSGQRQARVERHRPTDKWARLSLKFSFLLFQNLQSLKFKMEGFPCSKNTETLHGASFEYFEQLSQLGRLQILNIIHVINSRIDSNLNLL
jgi:hypothetical protein